MGSKIISQRETFYPEYSNLKIYEICLESVPSVMLQLYVALVESFIIITSDEKFSTKTSLGLLASMGITIVSMSLSLWRLFFSSAPNQKFKLTINSNRVSQKIKRISQNIVNDENSRAHSPSHARIAPKVSDSIDNINDHDRETKTDHDSINDDHDYKDSDIDVIYSLQMDSSEWKKSDEVIENNRQTSQDESVHVSDVTVNDVEYSFFLQFIVYLLFLFDLYIRSFPFIFAIFVIRLTYDQRLTFIAIVMIITIGIFEYISVFWMKNKEYMNEYQNKMDAWFRDAFISYFTCLLNVLFTLPLKRFHRKNNFSR